MLANQLLYHHLSVPTTHICNITPPIVKNLPKSKEQQTRGKEEMATLQKTQMLPLCWGHHLG